MTDTDAIISIPETIDTAYYTYVTANNAQVQTMLIIMMIALFMVGVVCLVLYKFFDECF